MDLEKAEWWEGTGADTTAGLLLRRRAAMGARPFLRLLHAGSADEEFSYADVMSCASRWRGLYVERGLKPGDRIVVILRHSVDLYGAFLGALLGGFVPAMFAFPTPKFSERAYFDTVGQLLENARPALLIAFPELLSKLTPLLDGIASPAAGVTPADAALSAPCTDPAPHATPESVAFLQYSSGTTGLRKGVAISHQALLWQTRHYARAIGLRADDSIVTWLPLYHDMGLVACFLIPFLTGTPIVALSAFDWVKRPGRLLQALAQHRGTLCWLPNFAYNFMARTVPDADLAGLDLSCVRGFVNCSEPVMAESHRVFLARFAAYGVRSESLAVSYAMAENTFAVTSAGFGTPLTIDWVDGRALAGDNRALPVDRAAASARALVSCGPPLPETIVEIVDGDGNSLPERHVGEIALRSPCLLTEYFRNGADTKRAIREGRLFTGDVGYLADGEVYVTGREKDMIIVGGQNVFPQDIEAIVSQVPGVHPGRCVALGVQDEGSGTELLVVLAETDAVDPEQREQIRRRILEDISKQTEVVASDVQLVAHMWLHKSSSGKLARGENRRRYLQLAAEAQQPSAPAPATAEAPRLSPDIAQLMNVVRRVLDQTPSNRSRSFGPQDALITSGAIDSFGLVLLLREIETAFGVRIPDRCTEVERLDSVERIAHMLSELGDQPPEQSDVPRDRSDIVLRADRIIQAQPTSAFWTRYYRALFSLRGVAFGTNLQVKGPLVLRLGASPGNLRIGDHVTLMPGVDLKLRDRGRIVVGSGVQLDTSVRIVAANDATVELGENVRIGMGTIINAGADLTIGKGTLIASSCILDSSEHRFEGREPVSSQGFVHAPVLIGEDVWLGARVFVELGSRIGRGAVVGVGAVVAGDVTAFGVAMGSPARVVKMRQ